VSKKKAQPHVFRLRGEIDGQERIFTLTPGENTIGANPESSIHLPVAKVSRRHAVVRVSEDEAIVDDLDSTNGTFVNGIRVRTKVLREGLGPGRLGDPDLRSDPGKRARARRPA